MYGAALETHWTFLVCAHANRVVLVKSNKDKWCNGDFSQVACGTGHENARLPLPDLKLTDTTVSA